MFSELPALPEDPILGISKAFKKDERAQKIDLGVGVFRTPEGLTPVMQAVRKAQARIVESETTKVYTPTTGAPGFTDAVLKLVFGADSEALSAERCAAIQTPGGCGALRVGAELLKRTSARRIVSGAPTWANHTPLFGAAGYALEMIPYYDAAASAIDFNAYLAAVKKLGPQDVLLLHGPCHNPTGADLSRAQINAVFDAAKEQGFLPFIDCAYIGFAEDLDADAYIVREAARRLPEAMITFSCSKNFGLYRERTGALILVGENAERADALRSQAINVARGNYSMPPAHGGLIVAEILGSAELEALWREELAAMAATVRGNRQLLVDAASAVGLGNRLSYIAEQRGMFSLLPMTEESVTAAKERHGVYIVGAGRINLCGIHAGNAEYLAAALKDVMGQ